MRALAVVVVILSLITSVTQAQAGRRRPKRVALAASVKELPTKKVRDRSIGAPWSGHLQAPVKLAPDERYFLRRPWRTYGTRTTIELVHQALVDTLEELPTAHTLAIGDLSQESGGFITEHHSHQSGRDIDVGLFYKKKPAGYPAAFVVATAATLDAAATWKLVANFARTRNEDGGVQYIFLDQRLQSVLYHWAEKQGISDKRIAAVSAVLRHEPNHDNHMHVRFKCRARDTECL